MKTLIISFVLSLNLSAVAAQTSDTTKFKVYGNCGMCKTRIENAAKADGVEKATWSQETKILTLVYNPEKISLDQVHIEIAKSGHDTKEARAAEETYQKLPACCKYERPAVKEHEHH